MTAAYGAFAPDLAAPGAPETLAVFADEALAAGVRRLVLLSARGEDEAQRAERLLQESGADWTILRCSFFAQNFSEGQRRRAGARGRCGGRALRAPTSRSLR